MPSDDASLERSLKMSHLDADINDTPGWRRATLAAYLIVIALGVPYWWYTTSIERLSLPVQAIDRLGSELNTTLSRAPFVVEVVCEDTQPGITCQRTRESVEAFRSDGSLGWVWTEAATGGNVVYLSAASSADQHQPIFSYASSRAFLSVPRELLAQPEALMAVLDQTLPSLRHSHRAIGFSPNITLSFVLLNEDSSAGGYASDWPVVQALEDHLLPLLHDFTRLHAFSIETQILFHAPLRFQPAQQVAADGSEEWLISENQIKNFVNTEQWSLDSGSSNNPVLRFLLFVPSTAHTPLRLASSTSPAFLIPQYGGVVIQNLQGEPAALDLTLQTLDRPFSYFTAHLSALLGLPAAPHALDGSAEDLAQWQLDTLVRMRTRENYREAVETLGGIVRLVSKIREMKVGRDVQRNVEEAVDGLQKMLSRAATLSQQDLLDLSRDAVQRANRAFFHPDSVGLLYFPQEHKVAVLGPLFAPIAVPLLVSLVKEFKFWRLHRRLERAGAS